ncbi:MAG: SPOR domain-containing protein, partial [Microcoleaceae cyanobacterium]
NSPSPSITNSPNPIPLKSNDGFYYVVTNYVDEASWQKARGVIPDAYIRQGSDGSQKIQLGAFNDEKSARRFVQELQEKGLVGQYYRF